MLPYPVPPVGRPVSLDKADGPWSGEVTALQLFFHLLADMEVPGLAPVGVAGRGEWGEAPPSTAGTGELGSNGSGFANSFQTQASGTKVRNVPETDQAIQVGQRRDLLGTEPTGRPDDEMVDEAVPVGIHGEVMGMAMVD